MENTKTPAISLLEKNDWEGLARFCSPESIEALEHSLVSLEAGASPTPSFKLYGRTDVSLVTDFLSSLRKEGKYPQWMLDYEDTRVEKFGPQGGHAPWAELEDDFLLYGSRPVDVSHVSPQLLWKMEDRYSNLRCQMWSVDTAVQYLKKEKLQDRAAGWNTFQLKKTDPKAITEAVRLARNGNWTRGYGYVFSRYNKKKKRIFMPMPFSLMIKQSQYFVPFLRAIQDSLLRDRSDSPYLFWADKVGFDKCFEILTEKMRKSRTGFRYLVWVQRDFEKMDTTTGFSQYRTFVDPVIGSAMHYKPGSAPYREMASVLDATTTMPIVTPTGTMTVEHGTASGAEITNGGETICNDYYAARVNELMSYFGRNEVEILSCGNGDDGMSLWGTNDLEGFKTRIQEAASQAAEECGFRVQSDKWFISDIFGLYCQNMVWLEDRQIHFAYPAALILNSIINPEHEYTPSQWDRDYRDLDIIQKLDNGKGLPYFHQLIEYVRKGMKYPLLGSSQAETKRILSKYERYRSLQPLSENFNRQDWNITSSPTVKYLLGL